ncbi:hypothetical protein V6N11_071653 [Hibiscus sabdariffa]|uniref:Uncharacterized protein n=1 Tax=Hibiscus sabdariffa TaxID=183260 RepID=A0ABR2U0Z3_9ROSI
MENPKLSECTADGLMTGDCPALASSLVNGRPPDTVPVVVSGPAFERPGSPLAADNQRDSKKIELVAPVVEQVSGIVTGVQLADLNIQGNSTVEKLNSNKAVSKTVGTVEKVKDVANGSGKKAGVGRSMVSKAVVMSRVEGQHVLLVEHAGHSKVHAAVSIFEQGHGKVGSEKNVLGQNMGGKAKGVKENAKQGLKIRKHSEMRTIFRPVLSEWVDNMNSQLDSFAMDRELDPGGGTRVCVNQEGVLEKTPSLKNQYQNHSGFRTVEIESSDHVIDLGR